MSKLNAIPDTSSLELFLAEGIRQAGGKKQSSIIHTVCRELAELKGWAKTTKDIVDNINVEDTDITEMYDKLRQYLMDQIEKLQKDNDGKDEFMNGSIAALMRVADIVEDDVVFLTASKEDSEVNFYPPENNKAPLTYNFDGPPG